MEWGSWHCTGDRDQYHPSGSSQCSSPKYPVSNLDWWYISYMILYMLQYHSPNLLLLFSQPFVRPPQTAILLFCISFPWGWSWSLSPVQWHEPHSIVHQALCLSDLVHYLQTAYITHKTHTHTHTHTQPSQKMGRRPKETLLQRRNTEKQNGCLMRPYK